MKFEISSAPVRAVIVTQPLISVPAFVMNILEPSITHSPSSARAVVRVAPASEPASGSVRPKAASALARGELRQPLGALLLVAEEHDRHRAERGVRRDGDREGGVDARQLLDAERVGEGVAARRRRRPRRWARRAGPSAAAWRSSASGKRPCASSSSATGADHALGESAHRVAEQAMLVREVEVHSSARYRPRTMSRRGRRLARTLRRRHRPRRPADRSRRRARRASRAHPARARSRAGRGRLPRRRALRRRARGRSARHPRTRAGAPEDTLDWRPAWEDARMRELVARGRGHRLDRRQRGPAGARRRAARARRRAASSTARACRPTAARSAAPMRASWSSPGRRPPGRPRSTPSSRPRRRVAALGDDLLRFARLGADDPPDGWRRHAERLAERAARLTALDLREIRLRRRARTCSWRCPTARAGAAGVIDVRGHRITPNIPTEEVFTSPAPRRPPGRSAARARWRIAGRVIEGIAGEFRRGRLVRIEADGEDDREFLAAYLARDRGAGGLGELALVDNSLARRRGRPALLHDAARRERRRAHRLRPRASATRASPARRRSTAPACTSTS